jgi:hypothetical protein
MSTHLKNAAILVSHYLIKLNKVTLNVNWSPKILSKPEFDDDDPVQNLYSIWKHNIDWVLIWEGQPIKNSVNDFILWSFDELELILWFYDRLLYFMIFFDKWEACSGLNCI